MLRLICCCLVYLNISVCIASDIQTQTGEEHLILIHNRHLVVGIWPQSGGRIVVLRHPRGKNVLYADHQQWTQTQTARIDGDFVAHNGHNIWLGPQSEWWSKQSLNKTRLQEHAQWPPDPYLSHDRYNVTQYSPTSITLVSPESAVSQVQLEKTYRITNDGKLELAYALKNISDKAIAWDIWSNTRVPGTQNSYVPLNNEQQSLRFGGNLPMQVLDNFLITRGDTPVSSEQGNINGKAFLHPLQGCIATFGSQHCLLKQAPIPAAKDIHPNQAFVEIFHSISSDSKASFLELEMHSAYKTILAGESHYFEETWQLLPYTGIDKPSAHVAFLRQHGIGVKK